MPSEVTELKPRSEASLIDQIHEGRIQKLESGLTGCQVELGKLGERMGTMETTISTGFKSVNESLAPISAKILTQEDERKAKDAQAALVKKYKTPVLVGLTAVVGAALAKLGEFLFTILVG